MTDCVEHLVAGRMSRLGTETAFEVLARARALEEAGRQVVHLEIGEPDFDTPAHICEAAAQALRDGQTHYGPAAGLPELREAIAEHVGALRRIEVSPDQVVVTPGAKPILFFSILALVDPEDEVVFPNPGFPIYESVINFVGARAVPIPLREERGFNPDPDELDELVSKRTKLLILNSPQNPTGGVLGQKDLEQVAELAQRHDFIVLADEVYSCIQYGEAHRSIASIPGMLERTIILDGFSKTYAMTGWRLGYGVFPATLAPAIARLQTNCTSCTATFVQYAGLAALRGPQECVAEMAAEFRRRRDLLVEGLNRLPGVSCRLPEGAFYAFPNISQTGHSSRELEGRLLDEAGVAALSGTSFGRHGDGYLRFSYANSVENIQLALERVGEWLARNPRGTG